MKFKGVKVIPFPEIENAYVVISARYNEEKCNKCEPIMSFLYANETRGVEWEPSYGPITLLISCGNRHPEAREHFFFPYITGYGNWTQLGVNDNLLGRRFSKGDYEGIFNVLKSYIEEE